MWNIKKVRTESSLFLLLFMALTAHSATVATAAATGFALFSVFYHFCDYSGDNNY